MPRAMVGPGSSSKRSASSDSIWRGMNFSCCATSASVRPCAWRASASALPTPSSVKLPSLERLVLSGVREAAPQLVGVAHFGGALAAAALDTHREPERFRGRRDELVMPRNEAARFGHVALAIADLAHLQEGSRIVRIEPQRALEELLRVLHVPGAQAALARRRIRAPRRRVKRVANRLQEVFDRIGLALRLAEEPAVVVVDVRIVRRKAQRSLKVVLREAVFLQVLVHDAEHSVGRRVARVGGYGEAQFLERDAHAAAREVEGSELRVQLCAVARVAHLADDGSGIDRWTVPDRARGPAAPGREEARGGEPAPHARTSFRAMRA